MPAHRLWMKSGASGRAVYLDHAAVHDDEDADPYESFLTRSRARRERVDACDGVVRASAEQTLEQRNEDQTDRCNAAARHELFHALRFY